MKEQGKDKEDKEFSYKLTFLSMLCLLIIIQLLLLLEKCT